MKSLNGPAVVLAVAFAGLGAQMAAAQVAPPAPYYAPTATDQVTPKNPLLLALVVQPLLQQTGVSVSGGIGMLFSRFFSALAGQRPPPPGMPAQYPAGVPAYGAAAAAGYPQPTSPYGAPYPGTYPAATPGVATAGYPPTYGAAATAAYGGPTTYPTNPSTAAGSPYPSQPGAYTVPGVTPGVSAGYGTPAPPSTAQYPAPLPAAPGVGSPAMPAYPIPAGPPQAAGTLAYPTATGSSAYLGAPSYGTPPAAPSAKAAVLPSVLYSIDQLDPRTFKTAGQIDLAHGAPTLQTGDVFAIVYSTNVPGQVRIDNVDSRGQTTALGTYSVSSGHDNRIPVTKGIQLVGDTGIETFKLYFYPCAPTGRSTNPVSSSASAALPPCPTEPSPQLLQASKGLLGAKGAVNLDSPDPTIAVSTVTSYKPNDVTESDFQIRHVPIDAGAASRTP